MLIASTFSLLFTATAGAAKYSELSVEDQARAYTYYRAMVSCVGGLKNEIKASAEYDGLKTDPANGYWYGTGDPKNPDRKGEWWSGDAKNEAAVTPKTTSSVGTLGCTEITKTALADYWGNVTPADFLKAMNYKWNGVDKWVYQGDNGKSRETRLKEFLTKQGVNMTYTAETEYFVNYNAFLNKNYCVAKDNGLLNTLSSSIQNRYDTYNTAQNAYEGKTVYAKVTIAGSKGVEVHGFTYTGNPDHPAGLSGSYEMYFDNYKTCDQMVANITKNSAKYSAALLNEACRKQGYTGAFIAACVDGIKNSGTANYCDKYTDADLKNACVKGQGTTVSTEVAGSSNSGGGDGEGPTCAIEGIGWLVCPAMSFLATIGDTALSFLSTTFLETRASIMTDPSLVAAWSTMRTIANAGFVIAFLIIIFSQLTSAGISNYGVKKMLPRLVVAAILVNLSLIICQLAVDLSNILGYSINSFFQGNMFNIQGDVSGSDGSGNGFGIAVIVTAALAGGITLLFALSAPVIIAVVLALLLIVLILIARTALIVLLTVVAPLAFVAYLLPNTEQWFKRWQKMFVALLLVFPMIALVFGASALAARIVYNAADNDLLRLTALGIAAIPLFVIPALLRASINAAGSIGARLSNMSAKMGGQVNGKMRDTTKLGQFQKYQAQQSNIRRAKILGGVDPRRGGMANPLNWTARAGRVFNESKISGQFGNRATIMGESVAKEEFEKLVKEASSAQETFSFGDTMEIAKSGALGGRKVSEASRAAAIDKIMNAGSFNDRKEVLETLAANKASTSKELRNRAVNVAYAKGDGNIYGTDFGDKIVQDYKIVDGKPVGDINSKEDLVKATVANAAAGSLSAEHLVQGAKSTKYIIESVNSYSDTTQRGAAQAKLRETITTARTNQNTAPKVTSVFEEQFGKIPPAPPAPPTP